MNLLTLKKKKIISRHTDSDSYFSYDNKKTTTHLDSRKVVFSNIPGTNTNMSVEEILDDKRE